MIDPQLQEALDEAEMDMDAALDHLDEVPNLLRVDLAQADTKVSKGTAGIIAQ